MRWEGGGGGVGWGVEEDIEELLMVRFSLVSYIRGSKELNHKLWLWSSFR